ncbi:DUF3048 domain-containing protein [Youngiibacter multivorans]|uniref:DUF3048 domain-containing protein n=1 Tax=Youngiibacter multivorans TaxID=937251 RepID=A0ABS4G3G6_9CLOT|nr:DUF3048 domain-containing protein [Youngiibacter multivorans]MBP1919022.1 hypothetical protein [Youngiibacter multivorans]
MNRNRILALVLSSMLLLSGCGKASTPQAQEPTPTQTIAETKPQETAAPTETMPEPIPVAMYENVPEGVSPLTGLPYEGDGKAIMVQIENTPEARPQSGITKADLIYEMEVESQITRLTAFFLSEYPTKVGPVRSARKQHMYLWSEWDYMYVFYGGSEVAGQNVYRLKEDLEISAPKIDGMAVSKGFSRSTDRSAPHNAYIDLNYLIKNKYEYNPIQRTLYFDSNENFEGEPAININFQYASNNRISYIFNKEKKMYEKFINEKPVTDKEDGTTLSVKNIIIQYTRHYHVSGTVYTNIDQIGKGKAEYFTNGVMRTGSWERKDLDSITKYYDENNQEIAFIPGRTFVQIVRNETEVSVGK